MRVCNFSFGSIEIDGVTWNSDSLSLEEDIPWKCRRLVIGTGAYGRLPVLKEVKPEAKRRNVKLFVVPTAQAMEELERDSRETNAILHLTC